MHVNKAMTCDSVSDDVPELLVLLKLIDNCWLVFIADIADLTDICIIISNVWRYSRWISIISFMCFTWKGDYCVVSLTLAVVLDLFLPFLHRIPYLLFLVNVSSCSWLKTKDFGCIWQTPCYILSSFLLSCVQVMRIGFVCAVQDNKVTGRKADVILAAHHAAEAALRLVKPGNEVC